MARSSTTFAKGNPGGGRPRRYPEFVEAAREASPKALKKLLAAVVTGEPWAIQLILAYAWGKPGDAKRDLSQHDTAQLVAELRARLGPDDGSAPSSPSSNGDLGSTH